MVYTCFVELVRECPVRESVNNIESWTVSQVIYSVRVLLHSCLEKEPLREACMNIHILGFSFQFFHTEKLMTFDKVQ